MSFLWVIPTVLTGIGVVVAVVMGFRAAEELNAFRRQAGYLAELRPALVEVRNAGHTLAATLRKPRRT